jgi:hypothetical protein
MGLIEAEPCCNESGIGRCLAALSPPQNRACGFHRTRLPGPSFVAISGRISGGSDYTHRAYLSYTSIFLPSSFRSMEPLSHVCPLSRRVSPVSRPYRPGYVFLLPFGWSPSLLGTSSPPGVLYHPCVDLLNYKVSLISIVQSPRGFSRFTPLRYGWGGCSLYSGVLVSHALSAIVLVPYRGPRRWPRT